MIDPTQVIYLHGLESTSRSGKARQFAERYPGLVTPDFYGSFEERMEQLLPILGDRRIWTIIGSSFGGLMGAVFACTRPAQVRRLILLAPALILPQFAAAGFHPVDTPTVLIHGTQDDLVPPEPVRKLAMKVFTRIEFIPVEDGHRLQKAFLELDWDRILDPG